MIKTNGDIEFVTVSIPNESVWEIPYLAGKWSCVTIMHNSTAALAKKNYFYSSFRLQCPLNENRKITIITIYI